MSISEPFIRRPVATTLLMFGLLLAGLTGYRSLPVAALPQVDYPTIVVATQLPGARTGLEKRKDSAEALPDFGHSLPDPITKPFNPDSKTSESDLFIPGFGAFNRMSAGRRGRVGPARFVRIRN